MKKIKNFKTCKEAIKTLFVTKTNLTAKIDKKYLFSYLPTWAIKNIESQPNSDFVAHKGPLTS